MCALGCGVTIASVNSDQERHMNKRIRRIGRWAFAAVVAGLVAPALAAAGTTPGAQTVGWVPTSSSAGFQQAQCEPAGGRASFGWAQLASQNGL
jgi:hypothetical protein